MDKQIELYKYLRDYPVSIPVEGFTKKMTDFMFYSEIESLAEDMYYEFIADLEAKLAESEKEIASLEVCLLENKNNMKKMQEFKIGEDEFDLTDEDARNDLRDYIQEFEKVSKRIYEQKEYAEKILRMSTNEATQEILKLKQQLAEKEKEVEKLNTIIEVKDETIKHYENWLEELRFRERNINGLIEQLPNQNQTAIAELEKVKEFWLKHEDIGYYIDQQIKSLKGEK